MDTRTRKQTIEDARFVEDSESGIELDSLSEEELEALLFDDEQETPRKGFFNLPTAAGLSLILVGMAYIFQQMGMWGGLDLSALVAMLPWLAGALIILLGFGVLSWRPNKKKKKTTVKRGFEAATGKSKLIFETTTSNGKKKLVRGHDKKIMGVCSGIADYFGIDPTLVRIAFVIGAMITQGVGVAAYFALAYVMPSGTEKPSSREQRITIIRDR